MNGSAVESPQTRGKKWELKTLKKLKEWGYKKLGRTILINKDSDNKGVDIEARTEGKIPLNIQCKSSSKQVKYHTILHNIPDSGAVNVIFHEHWWKGEIAGEYALMTISDFQRLINK